MPRFSPLDRHAQYLKGVGPRRAKLLERLGISSARDLLYHTPRRYDDASTVTPVEELKVGMDTTVIGRVVAKGVLPTRKGLRIFQAVLQGERSQITCSWPGQPFLDRVIQRGDLLLVAGPVRFYHGPNLQPREYTVLAGENEAGPPDEGAVFPIYPATEGLTHRQIRQIVADNLDELLAAVPAEESLPEELIRRARVPRLATALHDLHRPDSLARAEEGRRRLALEELFFLQLIHARSRHEATAMKPGIRFRRFDHLVRQLYRSLPFTLTEAQVRALREIAGDMESPRRMSRLLQGDVGSGKTIVALFASLRAVENGYQVALMVPTEILAEQHARSIRHLLAEIPVSVELLTGRLGAGSRRAALDRIRSGEADLIVGTHALIQPDVEYANLGLAVIDEQHRFGVRQRLALADSGANPDVLVMSATPIPRSLALTLYGDLDISTLDERPAGRKPVRTVIRDTRHRAGVLDFLRARVAAGRQAYLVYPLVEESEALQLKSATEEFSRLQQILPELRLALLHGQMAAQEKESVMRAFAHGEVDILVSTTVVEVGIDVPNATVMVIEHAERFGLSQLHQLRGRVGRGAEESYCILLSDFGPGAERLRILRDTEDGFRIAEADLQLRGQGDLFGARQSGVAVFRWARLERDGDLLSLARDAARDIIAADPELEAHPGVREALQRSYRERAEMYERG